MIFGDLVRLKFPDICLIVEEKPRKNIHEGNMSLPEPNPGPLRDRRAYYRLFHSVDRFNKNR